MTLSKEQSGKEQGGAAVLKCSFMRPIGIYKGDTFQAGRRLMWFGQLLFCLTSGANVE